MALLPPQAPRVQGQLQQRPPVFASAYQPASGRTPQRSSSPSESSVTPGMHRSPHAARSPERHRSLTPPPVRSRTPQQQLHHSQSLQASSMEAQHSVRSLTPHRQAMPPSGPSQRPLNASCEALPAAVPVAVPCSAQQVTTQIRHGQSCQPSRSYAPGAAGSYVAQAPAATNSHGHSCAAPASGHGSPSFIGLAASQSYVPVAQGSCNGTKSQGHSCAAPAGGHGSPSFIGLAASQSYVPVAQGSCNGTNSQGHSLAAPAGGHGSPSCIGLAASQSYVPVAQGCSVQATPCAVQAVPAQAVSLSSTPPATQKGSYVAPPAAAAKGSYVAQPIAAQGVSAVHIASGLQAAPVAQAVPATQSYLPGTQGSYVAPPGMQGSYVAQPGTQGSYVAQAAVSSFVPPPARTAPAAQVVSTVAQAVVVAAQKQTEQSSDQPRSARSTVSTQPSRGAQAVKEALERHQAQQYLKGPTSRPTCWAQAPHVQPATPLLQKPYAPEVMQPLPPALQPLQPLQPALHAVQQLQQYHPRPPQQPVTEPQVGFKSPIPVAVQVQACPKGPEKIDALTNTQEIYVYRSETPEPCAEADTRALRSGRRTPEACADISFAAELMDPTPADGGSVVLPMGKSLIAKEGELLEKDVTQSLVDAAEEGNLEGLSEYLRQAVSANLDPALIEWAHCRKKVLEEECWSLKLHSSATQALQEALGGDSAENLRKAVERAQNAGVRGTVLDGARKELESLQTRQEAEEALYAALQEVKRGAPGVALSETIARAETAGVSEDLVRHARRRQSEFEEYKCNQKANSAAEQKLREMVDSCTDASTLTTALEEAQQVGVCFKVIESARKRKCELEDEAWQARNHEGASLKPGTAAAGSPSEELAEGQSTPASTIGIQEDLLERICMQKMEFDRPASSPTSPVLGPCESAQMNLPPNAECSPVESSEHAQDAWRADALPSSNSIQARSRLSCPPVNNEEEEELAPMPAAPLGSCIDEASIADPPLAQQTPVSERRPTQLSMQEDNSTLGRGSLPEGRTPAPRSSWEPKLMTDEVPIYGLDAELKAKAEEKYDLSAEDEAAQWVQDITGILVRGEFGAALRTGQVLCELVNCIRPGTIAKINKPGMPFKERENISQFLKACRQWGVHEYALFSTDDLYDEKNLSSVVKCIHQLGGVLRRSVPDFQGPHLGVADTSNAKRDQKRAMQQASQTGGLNVAMDRSHVDIVSTANVRAPTRGGC